MNPTTMIGNSNIVVTMNPDEARMIVRSLEDTMKGYVEAFDHLADDARHAMLEGDEVIVHECLEQLDTLVSNWKAQREMIHELNRSLQSRHVEVRKYDDDSGIPF